MKRLILFLLAICSFTMIYAQKWGDLLTEEEHNYTDKDLDYAFSIPSSRFVGKKWFNNTSNYFWFNQNGTGKFVQIQYDTDYGDTINITKTVPFTWKRDGLELYISFLQNQITYLPVASELKKFSPRVQNDIKKEYAQIQQRLRNQTYNKQHIKFKKFTNDFIICDLYSNGSFQDGLNLLSQKKKDEAMKRIGMK